MKTSAVLQHAPNEAVLWRSKTTGFVTAQRRSKVNPRKNRSIENKASAIPRIHDPEDSIVRIAHYTPSKQPLMNKETSSDGPVRRKAEVEFRGLFEFGRGNSTPEWPTLTANSDAHRAGLNTILRNENNEKAYALVKTEPNSKSKTSPDIDAFGRRESKHRVRMAQGQTKHARVHPVTQQSDIKSITRQGSADTAGVPAGLPCRLFW
ncbi:hypothetical protein B0H14DRAFT_2585742 [Mycena olivaceomarginata]|nr:hypothetical protein B0H14DRAFT_2585742 [Mycena olivaceomarginata]